MDITKEEAMYASIELWQLSGESQTSWCKQHGITKSAFKYWLKKYRTQAPAASGRAFIPLEPAVNTSGTASDTTLTIHYPNGILVQCPVNLPRFQLQLLLSLPD